MAKDKGLYFLDDAAKKKVAKARALDEALLGRKYDKAKCDEAHDRIFGKEKKKSRCDDCGKECARSIARVENGKVVTRCYNCDDKVNR
ncbi:MAG: hypothetical protein ACFFAU_00945 [Candidatus Hodarchaeota archaeon]